MRRLDAAFRRRGSTRRIVAIPGPVRAGRQAGPSKAASSRRTPKRQALGLWRVFQQAAAETAGCSVLIRAGPAQHKRLTGRAAQTVDRRGMMNCWQRVYDTTRATQPPCGNNRATCSQQARSRKFRRAQIAIARPPAPSSVGFPLMLSPRDLAPTDTFSRRHNGENATATA